MNSINKNILQIKETPIMEIANYGRNFTKETLALKFAVK